jgi:ankyrin repeat protein
MTRLFEAIRAGDIAAVTALLDADPALVDAVDDKGQNALTVATYNRRNDIAELLLARGAAVDIFAAAMSGNEPRLAELLGANPDLAASFSHDGWTPLHLACFFGHAGCARRLLEAGAPVNERSTNAMQNMPLHAAVAGRKVENVITLIEHGAAVNARQHGGWTPLHGGAQNGDANIVHVLAGAGADVTARADNGQNALDLAILKGNQEMVDILEEIASRRSG